MSDLLPLATYTLNVEPYDPTPAISFDKPVTVRITMAAIDPEPFDDEGKPSTLRMIKRNPDFDESEEDESDIDFNEEEEDDEQEEEEEQEQEKKEKESNKREKKHHHHHRKHKHDKEDEEELKEEELKEGSDDDAVPVDDDEFEETILLTLSPKTAYQQAIDITIAPEEDVQFVVTGSYTVSLTGNYVKHPFDSIMDEDEYDDGLIPEDSEEEYDEDELSEDDLSDELDNLEDASDIEGRIEELVAEDEAKKESKKRKADEEEEEEEEEVEVEIEEEEEEEPKPKKAKKEKNKKHNEQEKKVQKKVEFKKELEEGPTKKKEEKKPKAQVLQGGIIIEDRTIGKGPQAKKGSRIGMRYIGKLKNGKIFDKNTSGKPFVFKLGHGEVIKGWDIGVAGMAVGGERRIIIPAPYAYGKQALPGIPANSELTFDVKLVSMK